MQLSTQKGVNMNLVPAGKAVGSAASFTRTRGERNHGSLGSVESRRGSSVEESNNFLQQSEYPHIQSTALISRLMERSPVFCEKPQRTMFSQVLWKAENGKGKCFSAHVSPNNVLQA